MAAHASAAGLAQDAGFAVFTRLVPSRRAALLDLGLHGAIVLALGIAAAAWLPQASGAIVLLGVVAALISWRRRTHRSMAGYRHLHISADGVWSLASLARLDQPDRLLPDTLTRSPMGCVSVRGPVSMSGGPANQAVSSTNVVFWADSMSPDAWRRLQICVARSAQFHAEGQ